MQYCQPAYHCCLVTTLSKKHWPSAAVQLCGGRRPLQGHASSVNSRRTACLGLAHMTRTQLHCCCAHELISSTVPPKSLLLLLPASLPPRMPRPASLPQLESMVSIPPQASVTASVTSPNDSMLMIVLVCLGFYMLSATISAAIGVIMHLSGGGTGHGCSRVGRAAAQQGAHLWLQRVLRQHVAAGSNWSGVAVSKAAVFCACTCGVVHRQDSNSSTLLPSM